MRDRTPTPSDGQRVREFSDTELFAAMRCKDARAWGEFVNRFEGPLLMFARRLGIPEGERHECVWEVLEREGDRLTKRGGPLPDNLRAYLARALRSTHLTRKRGAARREKWYVAAADASNVEGVVGSVCSEASVRASRGFATFERYVGKDDIADDSLDSLESRPRAVVTLITQLIATMSDEDQQIAAWLYERVPYRDIARWLGVSYDAASKRGWRLGQRLRAEALRLVARASPDDLPEIRAFLRRVGLDIEGAKR